MGHHISKQQNRQMCDEHQRMNRSKTHSEPTTPANQVKANSLTHKIKSKKHSKQQNDAKIGIVNTDKTPKRSAENLTKGHECSAGSVVITIRLLKMESNTKDIETIANMNALQGSSTVHLATDTSETINENNMNSTVVLNTSNISNDNDKHLNNKNNNNNNLCENVDKKIIQSTIFDSLNENSDLLSMFNQTNEMNNKNSLSSVQCNRINSPSENLNCDTMSANVLSLFDRPELLMPSDSELGLDNVTETIFNIESTSTTTSQQTAISAVPTISQKILREFFPSGLISTVSPYPHHIPIGNIVKSECSNSDNSQHPAQSHHSKAHGSCCSKQTTATNKDAKETKTKKPNWSIKFNCTKLKGSGSSSNATNEASESNSNATTTNSNCANNLKESTSQAAALVLDKSTVISTNGGNVIVVTMDQRQLDLARLTPEEYAIDEDCDKKARIQRAIEIAEGVEPPPGFISTKNLKSLHSMTPPNSQLVPNSVNSSNDTNGNNADRSKINAQQWHMLCSNPQTLRLLNDFHNMLQTTDEIPRIHSQIDYIHCLVPDLKQITNCSYYWGKMDRYEAERLLENKPEGTFLLRDSAQEEFLFSVSFRKYGRSLHARIEQFNHKFSFDVHDPGVYTANTVTGLLEHYKDPACVMFFEPALTLPLNRKFVYSLQQLCRATIVSHTSYDGINEICLPRKLKSYLKEYHYRQRVKVRRFDESNYGAT